jgi:hypothetical protein
MVGDVRFSTKLQPTGLGELLDPPLKAKMAEKLEVHEVQYPDGDKYKGTIMCEEEDRSTGFNVLQANGPSVTTRKTAWAW